MTRFGGLPSNRGVYQYVSTPRTLPPPLPAPLSRSIHGDWRAIERPAPTSCAAEANLPVVRADTPYPRDGQVYPAIFAGALSLQSPSPRYLPVPGNGNGDNPPYIPVRKTLAERLGELNGALQASARAPVSDVVDDRDSTEAVRGDTPVPGLTFLEGSSNDSGYHSDSDSEGLYAEARRL